MNTSECGAYAHQRVGRYSEAADVFRRSLKVRGRIIGENDRNTLGEMTNLGRAYRKIERYEEAEALIRKRIEAKRRVLRIDDAWRTISRLQTHFLLRLGFMSARVT